jgi:hypothetical protein
LSNNYNTIEQDAATLSRSRSFPPRGLYDTAESILETNPAASLFFLANLSPRNLFCMLQILNEPPLRERAKPWHECASPKLISLN